MLQPKWWVLASVSDTHSVCVCISIVSFLFHTCSIEECYNDFINKLVRIRDNSDLMIRHYSKCP